MRYGINPALWNWISAFCLISLVKFFWDNIYLILTRQFAIKTGYVVAYITMCWYSLALRPTLSNYTVYCGWHICWYSMSQPQAPKNFLFIAVIKLNKIASVICVSLLLFLVNLCWIHLIFLSPFNTNRTTGHWWTWTGLSKQMSNWRDNVMEMVER